MTMDRSTKIKLLLIIAAIVTPVAAFLVYVIFTFFM